MRAIPCRSCEASIFWVRTTHGGRMPLDALPLEAGTILVALAQRGELLGIVLPPERLHWARDLDVPLFRSHFASCPDAEKWRSESRRNRRTTERGTA